MDVLTKKSKQNQWLKLITYLKLRLGLFASIQNTLKTLNICNILVFAIHNKGINLTSGKLV